MMQRNELPNLNQINQGQLLYILKEKSCKVAGRLMLYVGCSFALVSAAFVAKIAPAEISKVHVHVTRLALLRLLFLLPCCDWLFLLRDVWRLKLRWLVIDLAELFDCLDFESRLAETCRCELDRPLVEDVFASCRDVLELVLICACRR